MSQALATSGLGKRYRRAWALRDCSLVVPEGRVVGLVGPNGAGKSTLLQLAAGLLTPTAGAALVFGAAPGSAPVLGRLAFVSQDKPLYDTFTVVDLLRLGRMTNPQRWDGRLAQHRLAALHIPLGRRAGKLSGGQRTQVAITLALAKRPDLLLLDEPVADLDPLARSDAMRLLMETVAHHGTTVVVSSHALADLATTCDWLVVLNQGRVQINDDIDHLAASHYALSGPEEAAQTLPPSVALVARSGAGRQANLIVRSAEPPPDPRWTARPVDLEELVIAYLRNPHAAALSGPTLAAAERTS